MLLACPHCGIEIDIGDGWEWLEAQVVCVCGAVYSVDYDEMYDSDSGGEFGWFFLVSETKSELEAENDD